MLYAMRMFFPRVGGSLVAKAQNMLNVEPVYEGYVIRCVTWYGVAHFVFGGWVPIAWVHLRRLRFWVTRYITADRSYMVKNPVSQPKAKWFTPDRIFDPLHYFTALKSYREASRNNDKSTYYRNLVLRKNRIVINQLAWYFFRGGRRLIRGISVPPDDPANYPVIPHQVCEKRIRSLYDVTDWYVFFFTFV